MRPEKCIVSNLPMNDVVLVAVVDARENLFHKDSAISLGEFAALENLVEKFTTLADPRRQVDTVKSANRTYSVTR